MSKNSKNFVPTVHQKAGEINRTNPDWRLDLQQRSWQRWQQWRIGQRLSRGKTAFAAGAGTQVPGPLRHPQSPQGRPAAPQRPHHRIYRRQQRVRPHLLEDRYAGADAGAVPAHRRRPNIRGQVCDPERLPIRHRLRAAAPHQSPPFWQALIFCGNFRKDLDFFHNTLYNENKLEERSGLSCCEL